MLSGIGMTDGYEPYDTGTSYYAVQGPADVNRHLDDVQIGGLGYAVTPGEVPGVVEIDTGYTDGAWAPYAAPFAPGIAIPVMGYTALDQHNRIISGDEQLNGPVLRDIRRVLQEASLQ